MLKYLEICLLGCILQLEYLGSLFNYLGDDSGYLHLYQ
jgi:hypothetical protein